MMSRRTSTWVDGRPGFWAGCVQYLAMRRRCQRSKVSGVTSHPWCHRRGSAWAIAASIDRSIDRHRCGQVLCSVCVRRRVGGAGPSSPGLWSGPYERRGGPTTLGSGTRCDTHAQDRRGFALFNCHVRILGTHTVGRASHTDDELQRVPRPHGRRSNRGCRTSLRVKDRETRASA